MEMYLNCYPPTEVSPEDFHYLSGIKFTLNDWGYLWCREAIRRNEYLHVIVIERMGIIIPEGYIVDHKDTNVLNNQRHNLRVATRGQNQANRNKPKSNKSGYKGVSYCNVNKKWRAGIKVDSVATTLGYYETPEEAYVAYCEAAKFHFGEFANLG